MKVFRIAETQNINDLSGIGARIYGGRWNQKGTAILYTSESVSLATVEYLVHVPLSIAPTNLNLATFQIPDEITPEEIISTDLPVNWREYPAPSVLAESGTDWVRANKSLLLRVPSVVVAHEFNILINPLHPDMKHVTILQVENYKADKRLFRSERKRKIE